MDLREFLRVIRARVWIIVIAAVITTSSALALSMLSDHVYEAEASLLVSESDARSAFLSSAIAGFSAQPERSLQTQVRMFRMRPAFERTVRRLDLRMHPDQLIASSEVVAEGQTNVISIRVKDGNPERAALIANTLAEEYSLWVREFSRERIRAAADEVRAELDDVRGELLAAGGSGRTLSEREKVALQLASQDYASLSEQLRQLQIQEQMEIGPVQVVNTAAVPETAVSPRPVRDGAIALVLGLGLGFGLAYITEILDTSVKTGEDLAAIAGAPVLGIVPLQKEDIAGGVVLNRTASTPVAEAFRGIRNSLDFINFEHDIKTLLVTSAAPGEGKSTVAANLAEGLARAGRRVVLVSVDFHRPKSAAYLGLGEALGLSHVLSGQYNLEACLQPTGEGGPVVLASGKVPPNPSELLGSERMGALIEQLEARADWVILDGPPVLAVADTTAVAKWSDGVLVVARANKTAKDALGHAIQMLSGVGAKIVGAVLLGVTESGGGAGSYTYTYSSYSARRRGGSE